MPRIRRWFHVSHDINSDPEVWELTDRFGERAFRVWVEILSIADRYDGLVPGEIKYLSSTLAAKCKSRSRTVEGIIKYATDKTWIVYDPARRVRNHLKYRPTRGDKQIPEGKQTGFPPLLHTPTHSSPPKERKKEKEEEVASPPSLTPQDFLQAWNEICASEGLPKVTNLSNGRKTKIKARIKTYPDITFWERVFNAIPQSDFLMGRKANPKYPHWKATIDWLIENDENPTKVAEGAYA